MCVEGTIKLVTVDIRAPQVWEELGDKLTRGLPAQKAML